LSDRLLSQNSWRPIGSPNSLGRVILSPSISARPWARAATPQLLNFQPTPAQGFTNLRKTAVQQWKNQGWNIVDNMGMPRFIDSFESVR